MTDRLEEDYTAYPSSRKLPRPRYHPYETRDMNIEQYLPSRQEVGVLMNRSRLYRDSERGTWRGN